MLGGGVGTSGFGFYRMNILSLIDPDGNLVKVTPRPKRGAG